MMGIALLMASCTEDYKDWADPITNGPEEPISVGISVSPASAIDFATMTAESVQLFNASITGVEEATATYSAEITNEDGSKSIALELDENNYVNTAELESAVYALWGRRPVARTIPVNVVGLVNVNGASFASTATTTLTATPNAPEIEDAYYITGSINGWADDVEMTWNADERCWQVTTDGIDGEYKFRANHDWAINWGGDVNGLTQDGSNLSITTGTYTFKLYLTYNGAHKVVIK